MMPKGGLNGYPEFLAVTKHYPMFGVAHRKSLRCKGRIFH